MFASRIAAIVAGCSALLLTNSVQAQRLHEPFSLHNGDQVVFYGDSITEQRLYTNDVETYIVTRFPQLHVHFVNSGWGGDTVNGGGGGPIDLRLQRDVIAYHPTVMTIMLGMNDGGYHAFDDKTFSTYKNGYIHILDVLQNSLPHLRLTLIQPSAYDDVTQAPSFPGGYNAVLVRYGQFVEDLAKKNQDSVADFNTPLVAMLQQANASDPKTAQQIIPGRVHPSPAGHLIMAEALLKAWHAPALVTQVKIDAAQKHVDQADNSQISDLQTGNTVTWTQLDGSLPMPVEWHDSVVGLVMQSSDFTQALDQENLLVSGLSPTTRYALKIDGVDIGEFTGTQFSQGINLATLATPMTRQAMQVSDLTNQHVDQHFTRWRTIQVPLLQEANAAVKKAVPPLLAALDTEEAATVALQHEAAQPVPHHYDISPALPDPVGADLALNKPFSTRTPNLFGWGNGLTDGSWATDAQHTFATDDSDTFPKAVTIDLGSVLTLGSVRVGVPPFGSTETVLVSVSTDGQHYQGVGSYIFSLSDEERHLYKFPPTLARYIRLTYPDHYNGEAGYGPDFMFTSEVEAFAPGVPSP